MGEEDLLMRNSVVNYVLCYITTARHSYTEENMMSCCLSFFKASDITEAKDLLYSKAETETTARKGKSKSTSELSDIFSLLKTVDESERELPKFLCDGFNKMPPAAGFEVLAEHIINLMSEISQLRADVSAFDLQSTGRSLIEVKEELRDIKIKLRCAPTVENISNQNIPRNQSSYSGTVKRSESNAPVNSSRAQNSARSQTLTTRNLDNGAQLVKSSNHHLRSEGSGSASGSQSSEVDRPGADTLNNNREDVTEWTTVQRRRRRSFITGSKAAASDNFKGVEETRDIYVGRCNSTVSANTITRYVKREFNIDATCECITQRDIEVKAFKVTVNLSESNALLDANKWPLNVRVRKFYTRKHFDH